MNIAGDRTSHRGHYSSTRATGSTESTVARLGASQKGRNQVVCPYSVHDQSVWSQFRSGRHYHRRHSRALFCEPKRPPVSLFVLVHPRTARRRPPRLPLFGTQSDVWSVVGPSRGWSVGVRPRCVFRRLPCPVRGTPRTGSPLRRTEPGAVRVKTFGTSS